MIREGLASDMSGITHVRTSVRENHLSLEQMAGRGITQEGIIAEMAAGHLGCWIVEDHGRIVAFSMADRRTGNIFALFVLPGFEGRGFGSALIASCEDDLRIHGFSEAHLDTAPDTVAHRFYLRRGWHEYKKPDGTPLDVYLRKAL